MVRGALILSVALLLTGCGKATSTGAQTPVVINEGAGVLAGVHFSDSAQDIRTHLGAPIDSRPGFFPAGAHYTGPSAISAPVADQARPRVQPTPLHYKEFAFLVSRRVGTFSMATLTKGARTRAGVAIGDQLDRVRQAYKRVNCGKQGFGEPVSGSEERPTYRWCRTVVAGVHVFFGGDPIESITLTHYPAGG
jgi:hypothetical protein